MLAIGRAMMTEPELLLLDEPSMGLAPFLVQEIMRIIKRLNEEGTTILLVEQNAKVALKLADYGYVLETGEIVMESDAADLREDERSSRPTWAVNNAFRLPEFPSILHSDNSDFILGSYKDVPVKFCGSPRSRKNARLRQECLFGDKSIFLIRLASR